MKEMFENILSAMPLLAVILIVATVFLDYHQRQKVESTEARREQRPEDPGE